MNARYFILAMLLMPMIFGCSKDNKTEKQIVGDWFMCYSKVCDSSADYEEEDTYTKETTNMFVSFYNDGNMKSSTNPDLGGSEENMHSLSSIQLISYADINSTDELTIISVSLEGGIKN